MNTETPTPMTTLTFSGESYYAPGLEMTGPGECEVPEDKAAQLLADFPDLFSKTATAKESTQEAAKEPAQEPTAALKETKNKKG
jgi:hypothetical protein